MRCICAWQTCPMLWQTRTATWSSLQGSRSGWRRSTAVQWPLSHPTMMCPLPPGWRWSPYRQSSSWCRGWQGPPQSTLQPQLHSRCPPQAPSISQYQQKQQHPMARQPHQPTSSWATPAACMRVSLASWTASATCGPWAPAAAVGTSGWSTCSPACRASTPTCGVSCCAHCGLFRNNKPLLVVITLQSHIFETHSATRTH